MIGSEKMTREEALSLIKKLTAIFINSKFDDDDIGPIKRQEYINFFADMDYSTTSRAIDKIIKGSKFCPTPSEIFELYTAIKKSEESRKGIDRPVKDCPICKGRGYLIQDRAEGDKSYEYILYCTECSAGDQWKYDGQKVKENKSLFYVEPVTKFYDLKQLKAI